jgi:hypothetical protein
VTQKPDSVDAVEVLRVRLVGHREEVGRVPDAAKPEKERGCLFKTKWFNFYAQNVERKNVSIRIDFKM